MDMKSQREVSLVGSEEPLAEIMGKIATAISGTGPALAFGTVASIHAPADIAFIVATTGSTEISKEVALTAKAVIASAQASNKFLDAKQGEQWSLLLPPTHIAAVNVIIRSLELGTVPLDLRNFDGEFPKATYTAIVPTQLYRALHGDERLLRHLQATRAVLVGGAHLSPKLQELALSHKINVVTTYGMSETSGGCVYNGQPLDGVAIEVNKDSHIRISGKTLASGYLNFKDNAFDGTWFTTQDLGEIKNGILYVQGRADEVIISGGENISITAIEEFLATHFPNNQCAAFAVPDLEWGQALHIAIVGEIDSEQLSKALVKNLGVAAKPKQIHKIAQIPYIGIGKVNRAALLELLHYE